MISLIAGLGTGKGPDPPLPHAAMRDDLFGKHSLSPRPQPWAGISVCIPPAVDSHCRSKVQLFSGSLCLLSSSLWGCFLAFGTKATVQSLLQMSLAWGWQLQGNEIGFLPLP